jgi:hypothetical protein
MKCLKEYYIERWLMANMYGKEVIVREMQAEIDRLKVDQAPHPAIDSLVEFVKGKDEKIDRLMKICKEIETHPHCAFSQFDDKTDALLFDAGHVEGHRCAAAIARKAREK